MNNAQIKAILEGVIPELKSSIESVVAPLTERIAAIEARPIPVDGKDGPPGEPGQPGQSVSLDEVRPLLEEMVKSIPVPADGKDGAPGVDGKDAEPVQLEQVMEAIQKFDIEQLLKDAMSGEHDIDIVAPEAVSKEMSAAIALLAEPLPVRKDVLVAVPAARPRKLTFERDDQNRIVAAIEE